MEYHFPAIGLLPVSSGQGEQRQSRVAVLGLNPPEEVTAAEYLITGEERVGIGLWKKDLYGVGTALATKRAKRGWKPESEERLFVNVGLEPVVEELICWDGGESGNDWFPRMEELPWYNP